MILSSYSSLIYFFLYFFLNRDIFIYTLFSRCDTFHTLIINQSYKRGKIKRLINNILKENEYFLGHIEFISNGLKLKRGEAFTYNLEEQNYAKC